MYKKFFIILAAAILLFIPVYVGYGTQRTAPTEAVTANSILDDLAKATTTKSIATTPVTTRWFTVTQTSTESTVSRTTAKSTTTVTTSKQKTTNKTTKKATTKATTTKPKTTKLTTTKLKTTAKPKTTTRPKSTTPTTTGPKATSVVTASDINKIREGYLKLVNQERSKYGASPLRTHNLLSSYAQTRSKEIITKFSHTRPNGGYYNTIIDRKAYPYHLTAEIIQNTSHIGNRPYTKEDLFVGKDSQIVEAYTRIFNNFKSSSEHYKLITDPRFNDTGIGISYKINSKGMAIFYIVQHLGDPK